MAPMLTRLRKALVYTVFGAGTVHYVQRYICGLGKCEDVSMEPTIQDGDVVLISPFYVNALLLQKGDIVFCRKPHNAREIICKRLVAMEGDTVFNTHTGVAEFVRKGHVWLEGDNKDASIDSRYYGPLPYGLLISKVTLRLWPLNRFGYLGFPSHMTEQKSVT